MIVMRCQQGGYARLVVSLPQAADQGVPKLPVSTGAVRPPAGNRPDNERGCRYGRCLCRPDQVITRFRYPHGVWQG